MLTLATAEFPSYATILLSSLVIVQRVLIVLIFVAGFVHLRLGSFQAPFLIVISLSCSLILSCFGFPGRAHAKQPSLLLGLPSFAVLALILQALSPVLRTLSEATTSDSIWALSAILFMIHLALADYSMHAMHNSQLTSTLSLNSAMFASVVLSSRLPSDLDVFALLLTALQLFAITPLFLIRIYLAYGTFQQFAPGIPKAILPWTLILFGVCVYALYPLSSLIATKLLPAVIFFLVGICPWLMYHAQNWKQEWRGPWDEAVPIRPSAIASLSTPLAAE